MILLSFLITIFTINILTPYYLYIFNLSHRENRVYITPSYHNLTYSSSSTSIRMEWEVSKKELLSNPYLSLRWLYLIFYISFRSAGFSNTINNYVSYSKGKLYNDSFQNSLLVSKIKFSSNKYKAGSLLIPYH